jgi:filamentous hemagglutinin family protein
MRKLIRFRCKLLFYTGSIFCCLFLLGDKISAQIPDSTLGSHQSVVKKDVIKGRSSSIIEGGVRRGQNLFHSFSRFNIQKGKSVYFFNPNGIENIIARITGKDPSKIAGILGVLGDANLFLINPNGIIFGKTAQLDLKGSFFASTADSILFDDTYEFSASDPSSPPLLTVNINPTGLRFGVNPGSIINRSVVGLEVASGRTLGLFGGNVSFIDQGRIASPGSDVYVGSFNGNSLIALNQSSTNWNLDYEGASGFQDIYFSPGSFISTTGAASGNIQLLGRKINVNGGSINALNEGDSPGGNISVYASEALVIDSKGDSLRGLQTGASFGQVGNAGNISIETKRLVLKNGGSIRTSTEGDGKGGDVTVNATEFIKILSGELNTETFGSGNGGNLLLSTPRLILRNGGTIVSASRSEALGNSGDITINASELLNVDGSGSGIGAFSESSGDAGKLLIYTNQLTLQNDGLITVSSTAGGVAGNLEVNAHSILLKNKGFLKATTTGGAGNIVLNAKDIILREKSGITTNATENAGGGNISINTGVLAAFENSDITANSQESFGGRISITAQGIFGTEFREKRTLKSDITATSSLGPEFSGIVELNTPDVNPSEGLVELPTSVVDPDALVAQNACKRGAESEFISSGRGGLPANPNQDLSNASAQVGLVEPASAAPKAQTQSQSPTVSATPHQSTAKTIAPAQGWVYNEKGEIVLVAYNPNVSSPQRLKNNTACAAQ